MFRNHRVRNVLVVCALTATFCVFAHPSEGFAQNSAANDEQLPARHPFDLEKAAQKRFPNLSEAERTLLKAALIGDAVVCSSRGIMLKNSEPDSELYASKRQHASMPCWLSTKATNLLKEHDYPDTYLDNADTWENDRTIRPGLIRWLAVDSNASKQIDPKGLWIMGARIMGVRTPERLDFGFVSLPHPLVLRWCSIPDGVNLQNANLQRVDLGHSRTTLVQAPNLVVDGDCLLRHGFKAARVNLLHAKISGSLDFSGSDISNPGHTALELQQVEVGNSLWLAERFRACGTVHLLGANIHGNLEMRSGSFIASDYCDPRQAERSYGDSPAKGVAIAASALTVSGDIHSGSETSVVGSLHLNNSSVGGNLQIEGEFSPAKSIGPYDDLISAVDANVKGEILIGMTSNESVDLTGAETAHLIVENAKLLDNAQLLLIAVNIKHSLRISSFQLAPRSHIVLTDSNAAVLQYNATLPKPDEIDFDGFIYQRLRFGRPEMQDPYEWIKLIDGSSVLPFRPQPYRQLAKVLADVNEDASRDLMIQMEDRQFGLPGWLHLPTQIMRAPGNIILWLFSSPGLSFAIGVVAILMLFRWQVVSGAVALLLLAGLVVLSWPSGLLLKMTIEYGYVPLLALSWSAAIVLLGWKITQMAAEVMIPSHDNTAGTTPEGDPIGREPLSPFLYSLNLFLPIVDLHQEKNWWPDVNKSKKCRLFPRGKEINLKGSAVRSYFWFQIIAGWVLSGFFIAGFSGLIKHG
jgi:hypothetical protein